MRSAAAVASEDGFSMSDVSSDWKSLLPSARPIFCFVNREGFSRSPPDTLVLKSFPGFFCSSMVYKSLSWENMTLQLATDPIDEAILKQLHWQSCIFIRVAVYFANA